MGQPSRPTNATAEDQAGHRKDQPVRLRGHLALLEENQGEIPWCGPAALALATGRGYAEASRLLRDIAPGWYPPEGPIVTAYWRDLLGVLDLLGVAHAPVALPERRRNLLTFVRNGLEEGWYLLRITDHFLLLRSYGFGIAMLYDNRHTGVLVGRKTHGLRHVTHAVRLTSGPLAGG
ncbi:hypothetical protein [Roseicella frigidaeris]|uniref:Peptidase C39-like domain-containing protein n=1 Tax=Roseicella frigidaeris TaxID=2230885 RepID=A0A327MBX6_9PROT|nr:hypothetical protein [Roseicella frigidaeris]RAI59684.1 hypothetical protein DOO78_08855 [Roseicella frigidaeris]